MTSRFRDLLANVRTDVFELEALQDVAPDEDTKRILGEKHQAAKVLLGAITEMVTNGWPDSIQFFLEGTLTSDEYITWVRDKTLTSARPADITYVDWFRGERFKLPDLPNPAVAFSIDPAGTIITRGDISFVLGFETEDDALIYRLTSPIALKGLEF